MNGTKIVDLNGLDKNYWIKSVICGKTQAHLCEKEKPFLLTHKIISFQYFAKNCFVCLLCFVLVFQALMMLLLCIAEHIRGRWQITHPVSIFCCSHVFY